MKRLIKLLIVAAFFNALSWIILIPTWQYPDEQAHFAQIQYKAEIGGIPYNNKSFDTSSEVAISEKVLGTERDEFGNNQFTYHPEYHIKYSNSLFGPQEFMISSLPKSERKQLVKNEATLNPPLYYFFGTVVYRIFNSSSLFTRVFAIRVMSSLFFLMTIFLSYKTGQLIFKDSQILPIVLAALVGFMPMLVFASTGVLPDTLTNFLFGSFILICLKIIRENFTTTKLFILFIIIILGAVTRQHFLITLFILPFVILQQLFFNKQSRKMTFLSSLILVVSLYLLGFYVGSLSFIRRFDFPESSQQIPGNPLSNITYLEHLKWTIKHSFDEIMPWYWGIYKWLSLSLPPVVYQIINRLTPIALIGLILKIFEIVRKKQIKNNLVLFFLILCPLIYFMAITTFDFLYRKNHGFSFGIQGRYFFPTIVAQMALLLIGFHKIFEMILGKYSKYALFLIVLLIMTFNLYSLTYVSSSYYDFSTVKTAVQQISQYKPLIIKGNILLLIFGLSLLAQALFLFSFAKDVLKLKS